MSDDFLSIKDSKENRKRLSKLNSPLAELKWIFAAVGFNLLIYIITYFKPSLVTDAEGDAIGYLLYAVGGVGFIICHSTISFFLRAHGEKVEEDETGIDAEFMGTYKYTSFQDKMWFIFGISAAAGGLNVIVYLAFLSLIVK